MHRIVKKEILQKQGIKKPQYCPSPKVSSKRVVGSRSSSFTFGFSVRRPQQVFVESSTPSILAVGQQHFPDDVFTGGLFQGGDEEQSP